MKIVSDLTRDRRPTLQDILINCIHDTIDMDRLRDNKTYEIIEHENHTFYYRVLYLFIQRGALYYTNAEVEEWSKKEILKEFDLPEIIDTPESD